MSKPKTAKKQVAAYFLYCPMCGEEMFAPGSSLMFTVEECDGRMVTCPACDAPVRLPVLT